jgi:hypothetical protein
VSGTSALPHVPRTDLLIIGADQLVSWVVAGMAIATLSCLVYGLASRNGSFIPSFAGLSGWP